MLSLLLLFSHWVSSLQPHELQHASLPCSSLSPAVCSNSCPLMMPCNHVILCPSFSSCPQSFPVTRSFLMSWLFTSDGQSIGASSLASVFQINIWGWFPLGLTVLISLLSKGLSRDYSSITIRKHQFFWCSHFLMVQLLLWLYGPLSAKWWLCFLICCLGFS